MQSAPGVQRLGRDGVLHRRVTLVPTRASKQVLHGRRVSSSTFLLRVGRTALAVWRVLLARRDVNGYVVATRTDVVQDLGNRVTKASVMHAFKRLQDANLVQSHGYVTMPYGRAVRWRVWGWFVVSDDGKHVDVTVPEPTRLWLSTANTLGGDRTRREDHTGGSNTEVVEGDRVSPHFVCTQAERSMLSQERVCDPSPCDGGVERRLDVRPPRYTCVLYNNNYNKHYPPTGDNALSRARARESRCRGALSLRRVSGWRRRFCRVREKNARAEIFSREIPAATVNLEPVGHDDSERGNSPTTPGFTWPEQWSRAGSHVPTPPPYHPNLPLPRVPGWPKVRPDASDEERAKHLARAYRSAVTRCFPGQQVWALRGDVTRSKHFKLLVEAASVLESTGASPEKWAEFACEHWKRAGARHLRDKPPGVKWVYSARVITKHAGAKNYAPRRRGAGTAIPGRRALKLQSKWQFMLAELDRVGAEKGSEEERLVVERYFPRSSYERELRAACDEAEDEQVKLRERARGGEWLW
jgi:hypothetical protein